MSSRSNTEESSPNKLLMKAVQFNDVALTRQAIYLNANVNLENRMKSRPIHIASENGHVRIVKLLVSVKDIELDRQDIFGYTPLALAITSRRYKIVKTLLKSGADPNQFSILGFSPVHLAVIHSDLQILKLLISYKANINRKDCFGKSPLYVAIFQTKSFQMIQTLLESGANPHFRSKTGLPLLHELVLAASDAKMLAIVQLLVSRGVDVNERDDVKQETALHRAAAIGYQPVISFLVAQGGDLDAVNIHNLRPYDIAILHLNKKTAEMLRYLEYHRDEEDLKELSSLRKRQKKRIRF